MAKPLIGISLSGCVEDIVKGNVNIDDVTKIVTGTMADGEDWHRLLKDYERTRWSFRDLDARECVRVAQVLMTEGRVEQPRLKNPRHYPMNRSDGVLWLESEDDIIWSDGPVAA